MASHRNKSESRNGSINNGSMSNKIATARKTKNNASERHKNQQHDKTGNTSIKTRDSYQGTEMGASEENRSKNKQSNKQKEEQSGRYEGWFERENSFQTNPAKSRRKETSTKSRKSHGEKQWDTLDQPLGQSPELQHADYYGRVNAQQGYTDHNNKRDDSSSAQRFGNNDMRNHFGDNPHSREYDFDRGPYNESGRGGHYPKNMENRNRFDRDNERNFYEDNDGFQDRESEFRPQYNRPNFQSGNHPYENSRDDHNRYGAPEYGGRSEYDSSYGRHSRSELFERTPQRGYRERAYRERTRYPENGGEFIFENRERETPSQYYRDQFENEQNYENDSGEAPHPGHTTYDRNGRKAVYSTDYEGYLNDNGYSDWNKNQESNRGKTRPYSENEPEHFEESVQYGTAGGGYYGSMEEARQLAGDGSESEWGRARRRRADISAPGRRTEERNERGFDYSNFYGHEHPAFDQPGYRERNRPSPVGNEYSDENRNAGQDRSFEYEGVRGRNQERESESHSFSNNNPRGRGYSSYSERSAPLRRSRRLRSR
jgi:hypothetical protein